MRLTLEALPGPRRTAVSRLRRWIFMGIRAQSRAFNVIWWCENDAVRLMSSAGCVMPLPCI